MVCKNSMPPYCFNKNVIVLGDFQFKSLNCSDYLLFESSVGVEWGLKFLTNNHKTNSLDCLFKTLFNYFENLLLVLNAREEPQDV